MKELNRTTRLLIAASLVIIIIVTGLVTMRSPYVRYKLNPEQTLKLLSDSANLVTPGQLAVMMKPGSHNVFIDIRSENDYRKGHLDKAVNIPLRELLNRKQFNLFSKLAKEKMPVILYGNDQLEANGPWMILRQLGFDNCRILLGGYSYYSGVPADSAVSNDFPVWLPEKNRIGNMTQAVAPVAGEKENSGSKPVGKKTETVVPKKKAGSAGGGC